jgi:hypothetical protein
MLVRPPNFDATHKYPLFVEIHGGAANMWRDQITLRWNYHLFAKPGYVVLLTNYTGSTGFGEAFARAIQFDPLAGPASDVNEAADEAIRRFPFIDATRQVAAGASYGGHLANWLEATTTRYKAIVSHAGEANIEAQWGTSDGIYHPDPEGGELQDADPPVGRRERLPGPDQQHARELERAPAHEGAEPAPRVAEREPLDLEWRRQPAFLRGSAGLARALAGPGQRRDELRVVQAKRCGAEAPHYIWRLRS